MMKENGTSQRNHDRAMHQRTSGSQPYQAQTRPLNTVSLCSTSISGNTAPPISAWPPKASQLFTAAAPRSTSSHLRGCSHARGASILKPDLHSHTPRQKNNSPSPSNNRKSIVPSHISTATANRTRRDVVPSIQRRSSGYARLYTNNTRM